MIRKYFPRDKNYILESVQLSMKNSLLHYLVDYVKVEYLLHQNPLGIMDSMAKGIQEHEANDFRHLDQFYLHLMGIFRYSHYSDNQLEFIFEQKEDREKYEEEWGEEFKRWTKKFCQDKNFLRAVLDLTVFYPVDSPVVMVDNRMQSFLTQFFQIRIHPDKGIQQLKVA